MSDKKENTYKVTVVVEYELIVDAVSEQAALRAAEILAASLYVHGSGHVVQASTVRRLSDTSGKFEEIDP
jgi:hypothetical protein